MAGCEAQKTTAAKDNVKARLGEHHDVLELMESIEEQEPT